MQLCQITQFLTFKEVLTLVQMFEFFIQFFSRDLLSTKSYYMQQHWAKAVDCFSEALALFQNYFVVKYRIAYAYVQLSGTTMQWSKDSFWKAIHHLEDCHKIYSSYSADDKRNHSATYAG